MLLTSTFLRLTGNVFAWEAALHKYMDRDIAPKEMLLTKDEGLKMADIIFRLPAALLPVGRTKHHPHCPLPGARRPPLGGEGDASPGGRWGGSQAPGGDGLGRIPGTHGIFNLSPFKFLRTNQQDHFRHPPWMRLFYFKLYRPRRH
jgi:hypothetical protein